ncbi:MAG: spore germination protein [Deltaproteobacteria bacterium]
MKKKNNLSSKIDEFSKINLGISIRKLSSGGKELLIAYIPQLTDKDSLSSNIIKPILQYNKKETINNHILSSSVIYIDEVFLDHDENKMLDYILKGNTVIVIPSEPEYLIANTLKVEKRNIDIPQTQTGLKLPLDAFNENFDSNLSLIRYRIKDSALRIENFTIGKRTKTRVSMIYINDISNPKYVDEVKKKLEAISIDGIIESGYIQKFLLSNASSIFPQIGIAERSDKACAGILNGKICILVEGSNFALTVPETISNFLDSGDEHYDNLYTGIFTKILRIIALFSTLSLSSIYVMIVSFLPEILPPQYILALANSRISVPVNSFVEAFVMEMVAELLREASIRLPKQIGPAIGIVGTIVIGQAAVSAGVVSPLLVIIISLSTLTSFSFSDVTIISPIRVFKFMLLILTGIFGIFGFTMGLTIVVINVLSISSMGLPYGAPIAPFNFKDFANFFLSDITLAKKRPNYLRTKDDTRQ